MMTATIIAAIIAAGVTIGTAAYQSSEMDKAQKEARGIAGRQEATSERQWQDKMKLEKQAAALSAANLAEQKRQFDVTAGVRQEEDAYTKYKDHFGTLANVLANNTQLEDLFINRLKGLRG